MTRFDLVGIAAFAAMQFTGARVNAGGGFGHIGHKRGSVGVSGLGVANMGVATYGVAPYGVTSLGMTSFGVAPYGVTGVAPMGFNSYGMSPVGLTSFGVNTQPYFVQSDFGATGIADEFARQLGRALLQRIIQNPPRLGPIVGDPLDSRIEELRRRVAALESDVATIKTDVNTLKSKTTSLGQELQVTRALGEQHDKFLEELYLERTKANGGTK